MLSDSWICRFLVPVSFSDWSVDAYPQHGPLCIATAASPAVTTTNEDCLFLDVYAPTNASTGSKLPVYFYIQGGGFNTNSNGNFNGRGLIAASGYNIIVVTFNYRVGPYGFLAGSEVAAGGSLNNGLKDQLKALQWVQKYISHVSAPRTLLSFTSDTA